MPEIQLLNASVDSDDTSDLRILVDRRLVKYLTVEQGVYNIDTMCFGPLLAMALPPLPAEDWTQGHITRHEVDGCPVFASFHNTPLPGVSTDWHPLRVDQLEFDLGRALRSNVYEATCSKFKEVVVVKYARFPHEIQWFYQETEAYRWIDGHDMGPAFLAHLTEEDRIIGIVIERFADACHPGPEDYEPCRRALEKLHQLGIKHGDINKHNFLVRDGVAKLIDFGNAQRFQDAGALDEEMTSLEKELRDISGRGGILEDEPRSCDDT